MDAPNVPALANLSVPDLVEWGRRAIVQAGSFVEVRGIKATADAVAAYQRSIGAAQEAVDAAVEISLRAKRRMGAEIGAGQERGEIATAGGDRTTIVPDRNNGPATLEELGFRGSAGRKEAAGYKALAGPSEEQFDAVVDAVRETGPLTTGKVRDLSRRAAANNWSAGEIKKAAREEARTAYRAEVAKEENPRGITAESMGYANNEDFQATADLIGAIEDLRSNMLRSPAETARTASAAAARDLRRHAPAIIEWFTQLAAQLEERSDAA